MELVPTTEQTALSVINKSEIEQQIATAKQYPRDIDRLLAQSETIVTRSEETAVSCLYALPRGGKLIEGPSVDFADILLTQWGNCRAMARILDVGERTVRGQGLFFDLQSNVAVARETERRIVDRNGKRYNDDMIVMTGNAAARVAYRNAILSGIPKPLWQSAYSAARDVAGGPPEEFEDRKKKMLAFFKQHGVSERELFGYIFRTTGAEITRIEYLTRSHVVLLRAFANSLVDRIEDPEPEAEVRGPPEINQRIAETAKAKKATPKQKRRRRTKAEMEAERESKNVRLIEDAAKENKQQDEVVKKEPMRAIEEPVHAEGGTQQTLDLPGGEGTDQQDEIKSSSNPGVEVARSMYGNAQSIGDVDRTETYLEKFTWSEAEAAELYECNESAIERIIGK